MGDDKHRAGGTDQEILVKRIAGFTGGLTLVIAGAALVCWLLYGVLRQRLTAEDPPASPLAEVREPVVPPEPRLQRSPVEDMASLREHENGILRGYGWADEEAATGRIPVERAMELMVDRGLRPALSESESGSLPDGGVADAGAEELGTGDMGLQDAGILDIGPRGRAHGEEGER